MTSNNKQLYNDNYYDDSYLSLRKKAPVAMSFVLACANSKCTHNYTTNTTTWTEDPDDKWLLHLSCQKCKAEWSICCQCSNFKVIMKSRRQICVHRYSFHTEKGNNKRKLKLVMKDNKRKKTNDSAMVNNITTTANDISHSKYYFHDFFHE